MRGKPPKEILDRRAGNSQQPKKQPTMDALRTTDRKSRYLAIAAKLIGHAILWISAILGVVSGWVSLIPHVTVTQNQALDPSRPLTTPFVITNEGPLAIRDVNFFCTPYNIQTRSGGGLGSTNVGFTQSSLWPGLMQPGEQGTIECLTGVEIGSKQDPIVLGEVGITVTFKAWYVPFKTFERKSRFVTQSDPEGRLYWYPQPAKRK